MSTTASDRPIFAALVPANMAEPIKVIPLNGFADLYPAIGCDLVQPVQNLLGIDGPVMWVDEEGVCVGKPMNVRASIIAGQRIVGNAVLTGTKDGDIAPLLIDCPAIFFDRINVLAKDWIAKFQYVPQDETYQA